MVNEKDYQLVQRCLQGDESAFEELLNASKNQIFTFVLRMAQNAEDAEDITQDAFVKAFRKLDSYNPEYPFITWLFRIAHNTCVDFLRAKKPQSVSLDDADSPLDVPEDGPTVEENVAFAFQTEEAERLLASLPPLYREALLLQYREDLNCADIAGILQIPEGTVKVRLFRAKAAMKAKLERLAGR